MDQLWKKDKRTKDEYVDIFAVARDFCGNDMDEWDAYIIAYFHSSHDDLKRKDEQISQKLLCEGHDRYSNSYTKYIITILMNNNFDRFRVGKYRDALEKYNQSLCYAEMGTESECMAYANRSKCFMQMEKYTNALVDIELALKFKLSGKVRLHLRLQSQRAECLNQMKLSPSSERYIPKLSCSADKKMPCIADVLEITENEEFGRHVVAKYDIDVDKVVLVSDIFASATVSNTLSSCSYCNKIEQNFIACDECPNAMFCIDSCSDRNDVHQLECGSIFQLIGDTEMKLPVQTILMAIKMFPTVKDLMDFVGTCIKNNELPKKVKDLKSRYALFLKLSQNLSSLHLYPAYSVYTTLMNIHRVNSLFDTKQKRKFLMHLTIHHITIIRTNQFRHERKNIGAHKMRTDYVYDVLSLINHSCSPNLFNYSTPDNIGYCMTVRPIWKGEQVFINYLGNDTRMSRVERQEKLKLAWNFDCKCEKCKSDQTFETDVVNADMEQDASYQYVSTTCQRAKCKVNNSNCGKRQLLKNECVKFLNKFGHLTWSREIQIVTNCLTLH